MLCSLSASWESTILVVLCRPLGGVRTAGVLGGVSKVGRRKREQKRDIRKEEHFRQRMVRRLFLALILQILDPGN